MLNLLKRIWNLITFRASDTVHDAEWDNPEAVYNQALTRKKTRLEQFINAVADFDSAVQKQQAQLAERLTRLEQCEAAIRITLRNQDALRGPELLRQRDQIRKSVSEQSARLEKDLMELNRLRSQLRQHQESVSQFEEDRHREMVQIRAITMRKAIDQSLLNEDDDPALQTLRERLAAERSRQEILDSMADLDRLVGECETAGYLEQFKQLCGENEADRMLPPAVVRGSEPILIPNQLAV